jgi:tRNA1(Val) A37 N6-methylase TrmN6
MASSPVNDTLNMPSCITCGKEFKTQGPLTFHTKKNTCKASKTVEIPQTSTEGEEAEFRKTSEQFNKTLTKEVRMDEGIFFTPRKARSLLFDTLEKLKVKPSSILEPSFGSGEFLFDMQRLYPKAKITGVEKNEQLFNSVKVPSITTVKSDFLEWTSSSKYDLIVGNPPYFIVSTEGLSTAEKRAFSKQHSNCMTGRPNMYILFLYKCLKEHLALNGYLAFIIPTSLYNCSYYQPMRDYIIENTEICHVETLNKPGFYEAGIDTMLLILRNAVPTTKFIYKAKNGLSYITPFYKELNDLTDGTTTIQEMGVSAKTGNIVWNQEKESLSDEGTLLIYSSNIKNSTLILNNLLGNEKKQYVKGLTKPTLSGPVILVERGYGNNFNFNTVLVDYPSFYAENHLNVIYAEGVPNALSKLQDIRRSFQDPRTMLFVKWFIGNGMLSASELTTILPIFQASPRLDEFITLLQTATREEKMKVLSEV